MSGKHCFLDILVPPISALTALLLAGNGSVPAQSVADRPHTLETWSGNNQAEQLRLDPLGKPIPAPATSKVGRVRIRDRWPEEWLPRGVPRRQGDLRIQDDLGADPSPRIHLPVATGPYPTSARQATTVAVPRDPRPEVQLIPLLVELSPEMKMNVVPTEPDREAMNGHWSPRDGAAIRAPDGSEQSDLPRLRSAVSDVILTGYNTDGAFPHDPDLTIRTSPDHAVVLPAPGPPVTPVGPAAAAPQATNHDPMVRVFAGLSAVFALLLVASWRFGMGRQAACQIEVVSGASEYGTPYLKCSEEHSASGVRLNDPRKARDLCEACEPVRLETSTPLPRPPRRLARVARRRIIRKPDSAGEIVEHQTPATRGTAVETMVNSGIQPREVTATGTQQSPASRQGITESGDIVTVQNTDSENTMAEDTPNTRLQSAGSAESVVAAVASTERPPVRPAFRTPSDAGIELKGKRSADPGIVVGSTPAETKSKPDVSVATLMEVLDQNRALRKYAAGRSAQAVRFDPQNHSPMDGLREKS